MAAMDEEGTRQRVRQLLDAMEENGGKVSVAALTDLASVTDAHWTIDRAADPPIVYVRPARDPVFDALSPRELDVAALVACGFSNREIADALFISVATTKDHVHAILAKTGLGGRAGIIAAWLGNGPAA